MMEKATEGGVQDTGTFQRGKLMLNVILHGEFGVILDCPGGQNRETGES